MGLLKTAIALGKGEGKPHKGTDINGLRTVSSLAYAEDSATGHFLDTVWSIEPLDPLPTIIYFNGATFSRTNRSRASELCRIMAKRGFLVINTEVSNIRKGTGIKEITDDFQRIVRWIIRNQERFRFDLDNVYLAGSTYGALAALWMAMLYTSPRLMKATGIGDLPIKVKGLGLFTGMTDTEGGDSRMRTVGNAFRTFMKNHPETAECLHPWRNHDMRNMPPVFQVTSDYDSAKPDVEKLDDLLQANLVPHMTVNFDGSDRTSRSFMERHPDTDQVSRTVSMMLRFFADNQ